MTQDIQADFTKSFGPGVRIHVQNLRTAGPASTTVLFGASGSGKSTVLRCLAGLENPQEGRIQFGDEIWVETTRAISVPPQRRGIGFVPQEYALFPHLSVAHNIGYGLRGVGKKERETQIEKTMSWLHLEGLGRRSPAELSGGQRQRVALARALIRKPRLLLLDEPLSALDGPTRVRLQTDLRDLLKQLGIPTILVTHDRAEALGLGDQLVVMDSGRIVQQGKVFEVFSRPANLTVAGIVAMETIQPGRVLESMDGLVAIQVGESKLLSLNPPLNPGTEVYVCIRAEDVILMKGQPARSSPRNALRLTVRDLAQQSSIVRISLDGGFPLTALLTRQACEELSLRPGDQVIALIKAPQIHLIQR